MDKSRIEDLYRKMIESKFEDVNAFENTPYSPEIAVIKFNVKSIHKKEKGEYPSRIGPNNGYRCRI